MAAPGDDEPGYGLLVTMNGGEQQDLALVRRVSPEDREFMDGELARAMREEASEADVEADVAADAASEEEAVVADVGAEEVSSDDVKVSKAPLADDAEAAAVPAPIYYDQLRLYPCHG